MFCSSHHTSVSRPYVALRVDNLYSRDITTHGEQNEPPDRSTKRSHYTLLEHNATQHTESRRLNARNRTTHDTAAATPNQHKGVNSNTRLTQGGQHQGHGASRPWLTAAMTRQSGATIGQWQRAKPAPNIDRAKPAPNIGRVKSSHW